MPRLDDILNRIAKGLTGPAPETAPETDPEILLDHITEVSKNARATWFGLLGLLAFVGVTLLGHQDADFFAFGAETQLPLVDVTIPVKAFFFFAPGLVAALYIYLHLYLMTLWDALGDLEQEEGATPIADRVFPWLISHAALWYRNRARGDGSSAPRALGWVVAAVSVALGWVFGLLVLGGLWLRSLPAHDEGLTLWIALCLLAAAMTGLTGFLAARARMEGTTRESVAKAHWGRRVAGGIALVILACLSWLRTEGGFENYADWIERSGARIGSPQAAAWLNASLPTTESIADRTDLRWFRLYPADLAEADLTRKPAGWLPWHLWMEDFQEKFSRRKGIEPGTGLTAEQETAFETEAKERYAEYISQLAAPDLQDADLQDADLRNADLTRAFLPGADLSGAQMQDADCSSATL